MNVCVCVWGGGGGFMWGELSLSLGRVILHP